MTTATKNTKNVVITAPKISTAWNNLVAVTSTNDAENVKAIENLVVAMKASKLSIRDIMKVIKDTGKESSILSVSHVEGLLTWSALRGKFADMKALPLSKQLSTATAGYKLLGAGHSEALATFEGVQKAIKDARKVKADKAKESAKSEPKSEKAKKNTLAEIRAYLAAIDATALADSDLDIIAEIAVIIEEITVSA